jgi:hypothetical protein
MHLKMKHHDIYNRFVTIHANMRGIRRCLRVVLKALYRQRKYLSQSRALSFIENADFDACSEEYISDEEKTIVKAGPN